MLVECRYTVVEVSADGTGIFVPGQEPCWSFGHVAEWLHEVKTPILPPRGNNWHTDANFPWDQLQEGERPLLLGEVCQKGDLVFLPNLNNWSHHIDAGAEMTYRHLPTKTIRPLPK